jgi:hypothetical protein
VSNDHRDRRTLLGATGFWISLMAFASMLICFALLQASLKTCALGHFFAGSASWFVDIFLFLTATSVLTGFASMYAPSKQKLWGILLNGATTLSVILIFWINS